MATSRRLEITISGDTSDLLDAARGHEPRASFVKRALQSALGSQCAKHPERFAVANGADGLGFCAECVDEQAHSTLRKKNASF